MTTIVAVKKQKQCYLAADNLTIFGARKEVSGQHVYDSGKIIQVGPNQIGIAGHPSWALILMRYFADKKVKEWKSRAEIFGAFCSLHKTLEEDYFFRSQDRPFKSSRLELLIVNSVGIFEVEHSRVVRAYSKFSAIGTGEEYALGALHSLYDILENPEHIATLAIHAAAKFDRKTHLVT